MTTKDDNRKWKTYSRGVSILCRSHSWRHESTLRSFWKSVPGTACVDPFPWLQTSPSALPRDPVRFRSGTPYYLPSCMGTGDLEAKDTNTWWLSHRTVPEVPEHPPRHFPCLWDAEDNQNRTRTLGWHTDRSTRESRKPETNLNRFLPGDLWSPSLFSLLWEWKGQWCRPVQRKNFRCRGSTFERVYQRERSGAMWGPRCGLGERGA